MPIVEGQWERAPDLLGGASMTRNGTHEQTSSPGEQLRIAAPPVEGAANAELVRTLAIAFGVAPGNVEIVRGHTAKI
jgi:uncharacterized protein YggU (UPF0235/DUF167 family)